MRSLRPWGFPNWRDGSSDEVYQIPRLVSCPRYNLLQCRRGLFNVIKNCVTIFLCLSICLAPRLSGVVHAKRYYSIQIGACRDRKCADDMVNELKRLGHNAFYRYGESYQDGTMVNDECNPLESCGTCSPEICPSPHQQTRYSFV